MDAVGVINKLPDIISGIAEGGTVGIVLKITFLLLIIGGAIWLNNWSENKKNEEIKKKTDQGQNKDQVDIIEENSGLEDDAKKAEKEIQDIFGKKK